MGVEKVLENDRKISEAREQLRRVYERSSIDVDELISKFDNYARIYFNFGVACGNAFKKEE